MMDVLIMDDATGQSLRDATSGMAHELDPRALPGGGCALPVRVLTDPAFASLFDQLSALAVEAVDPAVVWPEAM